ncbi:MAG TPA: hypothetical protein VFC33_12925 [Acidimicrobiia bacterium]|nr:hypothetical protein [Acidimicrobiia bacterium]
MIVEMVGALFHAGCAAPSDEVVILGREPDLLRLKGALIGWEDHASEENGLAWLAERVNELSNGQRT